MRLRICALAVLCALAIDCGKGDRGGRAARSVQNDSLMALFNAAPDTSVARQVRSLPDSTRRDSATAAAGGPSKRDTANTLESAIASGAAVISVDSGSKEDRRLDSLMRIANTLSVRYRTLVATHTHQTLAAAAHQDPAKQRRLLKKITEKAPERFERAKIIAEERKRRLRELNAQ